jgi:hypothetical protein
MNKTNKTGAEIVFLLRLICSLSFTLVFHFSKEKGSRRGAPPSSWSPGGGGEFGYCHTLVRAHAE